MARLSPSIFDEIHYRFILLVYRLLSLAHASPELAGAVVLSLTVGEKLGKEHLLTIAANRSGLQISTIRNIAAAWVFTLPAAALLSGLLFWGFRHIF